MNNQSAISMNPNPHATKDLLDACAIERDVVKALNAIDAGADVSAKDDYDNTPLLFAAYWGCTEIVNKLIQAGADVNAKSKYGWSALINAAVQGHTEIVDILIKAKADVNKYDGNVALDRAKNEEIRNLIRSAMNRQSTTSTNANTTNTPPCTKKVCAVKQNVVTAQNVTDTDAYDSIFNICRRGEVSEVIDAIDAGADVNAKDEDCTPLMLAVSNRFTGIVNKLIEAGANVNAKGKFGDTALMCAVRHGYTEIVNMLILAGADVNAQDIVGFTALMEAVIHDKKYIAELLIDKGANKDKKDKHDYSTALMWAAYEGKKDIAELLINKGARLDLENMYGKTALDVAKNEEIKKLLVSAMQAKKAPRINHLCYRLIKTRY